MSIHWIHPDAPPEAFPDAELALRDPDGLLAVGGDLDPRRLLAAYRRGIFPWYSAGQPILWWSPDPRAVLDPKRLKVSRSLRKRLRRGEYRVTLDQAFPEVIAACATPAPGRESTWITAEMSRAYRRLHAMGHAHSAECWQADVLAGGLYGVAIGRIFFGESMFSRRTDASKVAFATLVEQLRAWGYVAVDCQVSSPHLSSLGAAPMPRHDFLMLLERWCAVPGVVGRWSLELGARESAPAFAEQQ